MSQPPDKYERIFDFTDFSATQPSAQQPGQKIDQELNAARESLNETIDRLNEIQRDDGKLRSSALDTTEFTGIVNAATATATAAASSASASATTATTQAGIATTAATSAGNSATSASGSAATATAQTAIASAAATTATTKATEASNSAASALVSQTSATASAATATTKAAEASGSAANAATQASNALNSANTSTAQANLASASAASAASSASSASSSAITAAASAVNAAASAASIDPSTYLSKAGNLAGLASTSTARTNLGLGSLAVVNDAPSDGSQYARKNGAWDVVSAGGASYITSVSSPLAVATGNLTVDLSAYAPLNSPLFTGDARAVTAALGDNDTSIATTAFVQQELLSGTANAKNLEVYVRNQTGSTIPAGAIVYINGATGNRPTITLAQANNDANSAQTFGFTKAAISNNGFGYVIVRGELENIDTSALTEGVQLYLSPTTAGTWTTTKPSAPQHLVYVGICVRAHPTLGTILVAVQNGYEVGEIHDIQLGTLANNDLLAYESSTDLWKNKTYSAIGLMTSATAASTYQTLSGMSSYRLVTGNVGITSGNSMIVNDGGIYTDDVYVDNYGLVIRNGTTFTQVAAFRSDQVLLPSAGLTFSDATTQTTAGISAATAASTYYPLTGNPSGFITSSALSTYAQLASPALTGNVTITSNSTGAALFIEQSGTGNILTLHDQASDTTFVAIDQNGKVSTIPSTTAGAGFNIAHGVAPTSPADGDVWSTTGGLFWRQNAATKQAMNLGDTQTISGSITFSNTNLTFGNANGGSTTNLATGPTNSGTSKTVNIGTSGVSGSTTLTNVGPVVGLSTTTIGPTTAASTLNLATGATLSGSTKAVSIATGGAAGSTTNITIGSTTGTSTTTLQGATNGVTSAADTNSVALATTAYVVGQAGSATPLVNGTAAVGTSLRYARQDHVHPTDTSRAALNSPVFTGTPSLPTGTTAVTQTAGNNTTAVATTAFVRSDNNVKAWVNFNGTGTVAIRSSYNVSSITDNGTGDYTVNFTTAMADVNYSASLNPSTLSSTGTSSTFFVLEQLATDSSYSRTTTSFRLLSYNISGVATDGFSLTCSFLR